MKIISKIKLLLYQSGIYKPKTVEDKLSIILNLELDINKIKNLNISVVTDSIIKYTEELNEIIEHDNINIFNRNVKIISPSIITNVTISEWFSLDNRIIDLDNKFLTDWLLSSIKIIKLYKLLSHDMKENTMYNNSMKIKPYIINIENIVDNIILHLKD